MSKFFVKPTQTINYGQVDLPTTTAIEFVLDWQTDIYVYNAGANGVVAYIEELLA